MDNLKDKKTILFIDESVLTTKYFYDFIEKIDNKIKPKNLFICLDEHIEDAIKNLRTTNLLNSLILEGFVDVLQFYPNFKKVNTSNYFDFTELVTLIKSEKVENILIMTQKESIFLTLLNLNEPLIENKIFKLDEQNIVLWERTTIKKNAFYVDDDKYLDNLEFKDLEYVYSPKYGFLKLFNDSIYQGGEGLIYKTYKNLLIKIYHKNHRTYINHKRLQEMLRIDVFNPYINWPKDIIYYNNSFVGYVMDEIKDTSQLEDLRADGFEGFSILDRYEIAYKLLSHLNYLHNKNIVVGDLKLDNILISKSKEVYMIDTGSYQVNDYPCIVFHPEYTNKMYTEEELKKYLRNPEDEYFAINTILFELLVGKKPNYDRDSGDIDSTRKVFLYPLDISEINKQSHLDLQLWALMSQKMREMFYYYFKQDKVSYLVEWIDEIKIILMNNKN